MTEPLEPDVVRDLSNIGIDNLDPKNELHVRLVDAMRRTRGMSEGNRLVALQWVFNWDLGRYGQEFAESRADYEQIRAKQIVKYRVEGEKSGAMCEMRADATDEVKAANLRYRLAEQLERLARKRLDTVRNQIEVWRSENASQRVADQHHARSGT